MKKIVLVALLSFVSSVLFSNCTEENVQPTQEDSRGSGGGVSDPPQ